MSKEQHFVYLIATCLQDGLSAPVKIGISADPSKRLQQLQSASPYSLEIAHLFHLPGKDSALAVERALLGFKSMHRMRGEWLDLDPKVAAQLVAMTIGAIFAAGGLEGDELAEVMVLAGALPKAGGALNLNGGEL